MPEKRRAALQKAAKEEKYLLASNLLSPQYFSPPD